MFHDFANHQTDAIRSTDTAIKYTIEVDRECSLLHTKLKYRVVQLNFTPEIEEIYMMFERSRTICSMASRKQCMEYFNSRCLIQLDLLVKYIGLREEFDNTAAHSLTMLRQIF